MIKYNLKEVVDYIINSSNKSFEDFLDILKDYLVSDDYYDLVDEVIKKLSKYNPEEFKSIKTIRNYSLVKLYNILIKKAPVPVIQEEFINIFIYRMEKMFMQVHIVEILSDIFEEWTSKDITFSIDI